jgi:hypothetical protein
MTPPPPYTLIVSVYLPFIGVSLGYVTVGGYWQDTATPVRRTAWKKGRPAPRGTWRSLAPPPRPME